MSNPGPLETRLAALEAQLSKLDRTVSAMLGAIEGYGLALSTIVATSPRHADTVLAMSAALELWNNGSTPSERLEITRQVVQDLEHVPVIREGSLQESELMLLAEAARKASTRKHRRD